MAPQFDLLVRDLAEVKLSVVAHFGAFAAMLSSDRLHHYATKLNVIYGDHDPWRLRETVLSYYFYFDEIVLTLL